jgi:hypothetical protein
MFIRQNLATYLITGKPPAGTGWSRKDIDYDATKLIAAIDRPAPAGVVDHLADLLLGDGVTNARKKQLVRFIADHDDRLTNDTLIALLCLITALPEFQLC